MHVFALSAILTAYLVVIASFLPRKRRCRSRLQAYPIRCTKRRGHDHAHTARGWRWHDLGNGMQAHTREWHRGRVR